jgi:hypothetical protein
LSTSSSSTSSNVDIRCEQCGVTFTLLEDKEEHMKLEHKEGTLFNSIAISDGDRYIPLKE